MLSPLFTCLECSIGALDPRDLGAELMAILTVDSTGVQMNPEHVANKAKGFVFLKLESCDKSCIVLYFVGHPVLPLLLESLAQNPCRFQLPGILRKV